MWNSSSKQPNRRLNSDLVSETLMEELHTRMKEAEYLKREKESQMKKDAGIPDYTWLVSNTPKQYKITHMLKIELEDLASQIEPDDTRLIIENFRRTIYEETRVEMIPESFKAILKRHLVTKNLKSVPTSLENIHTMPEHSGYFRRRPDLAPLREKDVGVQGSDGGPRYHPGRSNEDCKDNRTNSAPASSWRFFRQSRIQPVDPTGGIANNTSDSNTARDRRANSVPTITTIV